MTAPVEILIVDDREEHLLALETILTSPQYELVRASSGVHALRQVLARDFAVILVDVVMPGMNGFELATIIKQRERSRHTPIIFMTASGTDLSFIYRGYSIGAVDYLMKPIDADVLRAKVAIFVDLFVKGRRIAEQAEALRLAERRERELELAAIQTANKQRYRNLADAIPQIVWTADPDGTVTYFNRRWYEYTGQTYADATGAGWMVVVDPIEATQRWRKSLATERVFEYECRLRRHDGRFGWHLCRGMPELDDTGRIVAWLGTYTDCDDLKRALDAAETAVQARDEFLSIASHELRTPLTTLQLRMASLRDDLAADRLDNVQRKLDSAMRQGTRLTDLVDHLLDVSRIAGGQLALARETFDLVELARELLDRFTETAARANVDLTFHGCPAVVGKWDRLRVEQIVLNLVSNAIKYAANAPVEVEVATRDAVAVVEVRDHGQGIEPADAERIFGPFERAAAARNFGGLGIGLFIAQQNAVAHGGAIHVSSIPGHGATFTLELPR